jgi:hypothetical protein
LCSNGPAKQPATHPQWLSNPRPPATFGSPIPSRNPPLLHSSTYSTSQIPPTSPTQAPHSFKPNGHPDSDFSKEEKYQIRCKKNQQQRNSHPENSFKIEKKTKNLENNATPKPVQETTPKPTQETTPKPDEDTTTKKKSPNWTIKEDKKLCVAWLNTSRDTIVGRGQKATTFWERIHKNYIDLVKEYNTDKKNSTGFKELPLRLVGGDSY